MVSAVLFITFFVLLVLNVPISICLGLSSAAAILYSGTSLTIVATNIYSGISKFLLLAIPFFVLSGNIMAKAGISTRLIRFVDTCVGHRKGGIANVCIIVACFFGAISGSGPATVAAIGTLTIPAMTERGYDKMFAAAVVASAGAIGVMIPPSNPFVVYGVAGQASVGKLFLAGITPGILTGLVLMLVAYCIAKKNGWRGAPRQRNLKTLGKAVWVAKGALLVPVIVLGGIYGGIMTPTEAAAVAAFYGLLVGLFVYRELTWRSLWSCCLESARTSAIIIMLMAMATIFGNVMTLEQVPERIASAILSFTENKIAILLLINLLLLWVGTFMEALAAIVILTPILLPLVLKVGVDPIHFGVVLVCCCGVGFSTPPLGENIFIASGIADTTLEDISYNALPFVFVTVGVIILCVFVPDIVLFLPRMMY